MNLPSIKRLIARSAICVAAVVLCSGIALAQDETSDQDKNADGKTNADIQAAVQAALGQEMSLRSQHIAVAVEGAGSTAERITLSGSARCEYLKNEAGRVAADQDVAAMLENDLQVVVSGDDDDHAIVTCQEQEPQTADNQSAPPDNQSPPPAAAPSPGRGQAPPTPRPAYRQAPPPPPPPPASYAHASPPPPPPPPTSGDAPAQPAYQIAKNPVTLPLGTLIQLRTGESVDSKRAKGGEPVQFTMVEDVTFGGVLAIPRGATVHGMIASVKNVGAGRLTGNSELALQLTSLDLGGQSYPLQTDQFKVKAPGKGGRTARNIMGGALLGAVIGGAAGGGSGAAIGAAAGGGAGTAASAATSGPAAWIPAEAEVTFHLAAPVTVNPVDQQEADRLAQGLYPGGPTLNQRGPDGRRYYAPVYYRPYYFSGGYYSWH